MSFFTNIMKFSLNNTGSDAFRHGVISNIQRLPGLELETPLLLWYTRGGSIPHISKEVLQLLTQDQLALQVPLPSSIQCYEGVKSYGKGISKFAGLQENLTYCSVQDPAVLTPFGYNSKAQVSVWSHMGRVPLSVEKFMDIIEAFKPDIYQALSNGDTNAVTSRKKVIKVQESSLYLLDECLEKHKKSTELQSSAIFGSVEGGYDLKLRENCAKTLSAKDVDGFVINGLHNNGPEVESLDFDRVKPILEVVLKNLPAEKPRIIHGCWKPEDILKMVEMGIDMFDSSLAYTVAERNCALIFKYSVEKDDTSEVNSESPREINLSDERYKEDFRPILEGCSCLTCRNHTRAYIFHLEDNKELLARTLLIMHNLHHYMEFFKAIRLATAEGKRLTIV